jgi:hypothetical protein
MNFKFKWFSFRSSTLILILSALCVGCGGGLTEEQKQAYHALKGKWVFSHFHMKNSAIDSNLTADAVKEQFTLRFTDPNEQTLVNRMVDLLSTMTLSFETTKASLIAYPYYEYFDIEYRNENLISLSTPDGQKIDITYHIINGELHAPHHLVEYLGRTQGMDLGSVKDLTGEFPLVFKKQKN